MTNKTTLRSLRALPLVVALGFCFGPAFAQTTGSSTTGATAPAAQPGTGTRNTESRKDDKLARADRKFIEKAATNGMFEVEVAQLAAGKATDPAVKELANTLVKDHTAANEELTKIANAKKVELPAAPPKLKRRAEDKMGKRTGADFDQHFVREVGIKDHEKDIKEFQKASANVKDPELKAWVDKTLPHLREHLAMAQKLPEASRANAMGNRAAPKQGG
jgi:putative membrane protein